MNTQLWNDILLFDFDDPISEYGFSTRLANENYWTKNFTAKAILEYKKFMYLAATADAMVSPSEIVDIVWHQHLIFTQSYSEFCGILGKNIQHVPSTHSRAEVDKFQKARDRTTRLYNETFGEQPADIWINDFMLDALQLFSAKINIRIKTAVTLVIAVGCIIPFYFLLKPLYVNINGPTFLAGFITLAIATFIALESYNKLYLNRIVKSWKTDSFIYDLHPTELVYLQKQNLQYVIHGNINELIKQDRLSITSNSTLEIRLLRKSETAEELVITNFLHHASTAFYPELLRYLTQCPVFYSTENVMNMFKQYFIQSTAFGRLFNGNVIALSLLSITGIVRLMTGLVRDKPVGYLCFVIGVLLFAGFAFSLRLLSLICTHTVPRLYQSEILPAKENTYNWDWQYFLFGSSVFTPSFVPLAGYIDRNGDSSSGGSSCGSSCGGGGGCGGGCGGCGGGD